MAGLVFCSKPFHRSLPNIRFNRRTSGIGVVGGRVVFFSFSKGSKADKGSNSPVLSMLKEK